MKFKLLITLLVAALLLSGCQTLGGLGRDLEHAGSWIEHGSGK
jgi:predicted small secreted protein